MTTVADVDRFISQLAPPELAEDWDNVGLLVGDASATVTRLMTCLTVTPESAEEAIAGGVNLIVTHHPLPFRALKRLTANDPSGRLLLDLIAARVSVISPHTAFDSASTGINQMLVKKLGLHNSRPLIPAVNIDSSIGAARVASTGKPVPLTEFLSLAKSVFEIPVIRFVGIEQQPVELVALACGSGGSFLDKAIAAGCDTLVTGEATFHTCLAARAAGVGLVLPGHHQSERFAVEILAEELAICFPEIQVWPSRMESDPIRVV